MKKYNLRCNYCGQDHYISYFFFMLRLLVKGKVYVKCGNCRYVSSYVFVGHIVHDTVDIDEKRFNKSLDNVWKRG